MFSDVPHVVSALAISRLVHDHHLEILLAWDKKDKQEFCDCLPRNHFSALNLTTLVERIVNCSAFGLKGTTTTSTNVQGRSHPVAEDISESVPWPNDRTKDQLMTAPDILLELKRAMGTHGTGALLAKLTELADQYGEAFCQNYKPYDQASRRRLSDTLKLVLEAELKLHYFEDAWPVRFYLLRRARDRGQATGCSTTSSDIPKDPGCPVAGRTSDVAGLSTITTGFNCPIHLQPDLSQVFTSMKNFFGMHGEQELIAPLALNGVTTDQQFATLRSLTSKQMETLVTCTDQHVRGSLNLFQRILLRILLHG